MPPGTLIIRADADVAMGTGHVMRCLALAEAWQDQGGDAVFAMAWSTPAIEKYLRSEKVRVIRTGIAAGSEEDAKRLAEIAGKYSAEWVVVDGYQFNDAYQRAIKQAGLKLMFVDDTGKCSHYFADVLLNQNIDACEEMYSDRESYTRLLLGTSYAMLRREFEAFRQFQRAFPTTAHRILVTMGGSDPQNVTENIIRALHQMKVPFEAKVIVGGSNPHGAALEKLVARSSNIELIKDPRDMPELMAWADIAMSAAGSTCSEMCLLGLPAFVLDLAANQAPIARQLHTTGCAIHLGSGSGVSVERMATQMEWLLGSSQMRNVLSSAARKLVDGRGAERVVRRILDGQWPPRRAEKSGVQVGKEPEENPGSSRSHRAFASLQPKITKIAICQPTYLPWVGYFDLIDQVDTFVLLDDVQFERQSWQQRNRIKTPVGLQWLTVPVKFRGRLGQLIKDVEIRDVEFWRDHCRAIELNYRRTLFFNDYFQMLSSELACRESTLLVDLNLRVIRCVMSMMGVKTRLVCSSVLRQPGKRTELLANICGALGAKQYISPLGSADYLLAEQDILLNQGIDVVFQNYQHPEYDQLFPPFLPYASVVDLLFNQGPRSLEIIRSGRRHPFLSCEVAAQVRQQAGTG